MENELKILEMILKADLTKIELKVLIFLLNTKEKTIKLSNAEMASATGLAHSNFVRALKKLQKNKVIGVRGGGVFVKSINTWKAANK